MRPIGFSTGALAKGDFMRGLDLMKQLGGQARAVELSALRDHEIEPLVTAAAGLDLSQFRYVSVHAPSRLGKLSERQIFELLTQLPRHWTLVAHPEILVTPALWRGLGPQLCIENMDIRKTSGRNAAELCDLFEVYPRASFCLDVGHAKQIDPTMAVALKMIFEFSPRLRQVHVSDVDARGAHLPLGTLARWAFARLSRYLPPECPLIVESVVPPEAMARELDTVSETFALESLTAIHPSE